MDNPVDAVQAVAWLSDSAKSTIQTVCITISALAAAGAMIFSAFQVRLLRKQVATAERLGKTRATVDVVLHERTEQSLIDARKKFGILKDSGARLVQFASLRLTDHEANDAILPVLNHYEFLAAAIREGAFDHKIYRRMKRSLVISDWDILKGYVQEMRSLRGNDNLFAEFEWLAMEFKKEPHLSCLPERDLR